MGEFIFNAPNDVAAFVGVWSDAAFDRMEIRETVGDQENEFYGQVYTGATPAPSMEITAVAASGTPVPGGFGVFTVFPQSPAVSAGITAFLGLGTSDQQGIYSAPTDPIAPVDPTRIADRATAIPSGTGNFTGFTEVAQAGTLTSFIGLGAGQAGIYSFDNAGPVDPFRPIADLTTAIPGGAGTFTAFSDLALAMTPLDPVRVGFIGSGAGQQGVYAATVEMGLPQDSAKVADLTTVIPEGSGTFTAFSGLALAAHPTDPHRVGFIGSGADQQGVYLSELDAVLGQGPPIKVADLNHSRGQRQLHRLGKVITALRFGQAGLDGGTLTFAATFADGSQGVFTVDGNEPFAAFKATVEIEEGRRANDDEFEVQGRFTLGAGSNGLDVPTEIVSLQLRGGTGAFSITVPAGAFRQDRQGRFRFEGRIDGVKLKASIRPLRSGAFELKAEGKRANLTGLANPVTVTLYWR